MQATSRSLSNLTSSHGNTYDYIHPSTIYFNSADFNQPTKCVKLDIYDVEEFDKAIEKANAFYADKASVAFIDNCHSHISLVLNLIRYKGEHGWRAIDVLKLMVREGKFLSVGGIIDCYWLYMCALFVGIIVFVIWKPLFYSILCTNN